jgi:hypothetical protein
MRNMQSIVAQILFESDRPLRFGAARKTSQKGRRALIKLGSSGKTMHGSHLLGFDHVIIVVNVLQIDQV